MSSAEKRSSAGVSPRNIDKHRIEPDDMVFVTQEDESSEIVYFSSRKPSVDTPIQLELYRRFPEIRFFIHGHATLIDAPTTAAYFPCGDTREVQVVADIMLGVPSGALNLRSHGFLLYSRTIEEMERIVAALNFKEEECTPE